jgi:hypothetical protein
MMGTPDVTEQKVKIPIQISDMKLLAFVVVKT